MYRCMYRSSYVPGVVVDGSGGGEFYLFGVADQLSLGGDLAEIRLLEDERVWLVRARREVEAQAKRMLMQGLELMVSKKRGRNRR